MVTFRADNYPTQCLSILQFNTEIRCVVKGPEKVLIFTAIEGSMLTGVSLAQKHCPSCVLLNTTLSPAVQSSQTAQQWGSIKLRTSPPSPSDLLGLPSFWERESIVQCFYDAYRWLVAGIC